jgi:hypothetical protein
MNLCSSKKAAVYVSAMILIVLATIVGMLAVFYVYEQTQACSALHLTNGCGSNVRVIQLTSMTFIQPPATLNFTLNNPDAQTTVSSVTINNQMSCNGNFAPIKANAQTSESCILSGATFTKGENVNYALNFTNGQAINGVVTAQ